jgi:hypothetical protein
MNTPYNHRWEHLLTQQPSITIYRLPTKENKLPFSVSSVSIHIYIYTYTYICLYLYTAVSHGKQKTEAQVFCLNPFTVCSLYNQKFVIYPFVDEETNGSYPFANKLNRLAHL